MKPSPRRRSDQHIASAKAPKPDFRAPCAGGKSARSRAKKMCLVAALVLCATACTIERFPHLYPANAAASTTGVLTAGLVGHGSLHGTMEITMPDGEELQGEYSIVAGGSVSVGNAFGAANSLGGPSSASATSFGLAMGGSGKGQASLFGNHGTFIFRTLGACFRRNIRWQVSPCGSGSPRRCPACRRFRRPPSAARSERG